MAELDAEAVERLSAKLHAIYQDEATRQADMGNDAVRHSDDYAALPEHTKECDRVLARYILQREIDLRRALLDLVEVVSTATVTEWASIMHPFTGPLHRALDVLRRNYDA
jgi:hypothetical protein